MDLPATQPKPIPQHQSRDARLAAELVANLRPRAEVAQAYGFTERELVQRIRSDVAFRKVLKETRELWSSDSNVKERVRAKAGMLVEDSLLDVYNIVTDESVSPNVRVSSFESLAKVADVASPTKGEGGSVFKVLINLPERKEPVTINPVIDAED